MLRLTFLLVILNLSPGFAQQPDSFFRAREDSMSRLASIILSSPFESEKIQASRQLQSFLKNTLSQTGAASFPFDSLQYVSMVRSDDGRLRFFTWFYTGDDRKAYFAGVAEVSSNGKVLGFLPFKTKPQTERVYLLNDVSDSIPNPEKQQLTPSKWYGALYYDIISPKKKGRDYILLGWDGHDDFLNRKVIEVASLTSRGDIRFGSNVFQYENKPVKRVLFEYAEAAVMSLRYNATEKMIVFDHLEPSNPQLKGNREYYGPDFSYEGYRYKGGRWEHVPHVIPTNENTRQKYNAPK